MKNIHEIPANGLPAELVEVLAEGPRVRIERIVSDGHGSPEDFWYDQEQNEWVLLISGSAVLEFADRTLEMKAGDYVLIPARQKHRVLSTSPVEKTVWLAVFYENE